MIEIYFKRRNRWASVRSQHQITSERQHHCALTNEKKWKRDKEAGRKRKQMNFREWEKSNNDWKKSVTETRCVFVKKKHRHGGRSPRCYWHERIFFFASMRFHCKSISHMISNWDGSRHLLENHELFFHLSTIKHTKVLFSFCHWYVISKRSFSPEEDQWNFAGAVESCSSARSSMECQLKIWI